VQHSHLKVFAEPGQQLRAICESLGYVSSLVSSSPAHAHLPMAYLRGLIGPALRQRRIKIYFNDDGDVVGFVIWAFFAPDSEERYMQSGPTAIHVSEWNEGEALWIIDFLVPLGHVRHVLRDLRDVVFKEHSRISWFRVKQGRALLRRLSRGTGSSFLRPGILPAALGPPGIEGCPARSSLLINLDKRSPVERSG
jgi:cytolysin-activating lysine-acyltransferase